MKRFLFLAGLVIGFVLGSRTGRGPYESIERTARQVADDPEVQRQAARARDTAGRVAQDAAGTVKDKAPDVAAGVGGAAAGARDRLGGNGSEPLPGGAGADEPGVAAGDVEVGEDDPLSS